MATQQVREHDYAWWLVSCALAITAQWIVNNRDFGLTDQSRLLTETLGLFAGGLVIGFCCPRGAWRWGLAAFVTLSLLGAAQFYGVMGLQGSSSAGEVGGFVATFLKQAPDNALRAAMIACGACVPSLL